MFVEAQLLEDIEAFLLIQINGSVEPLLKCRVSCLSQGPVVQITPRDLDWGATTLLQESAREICVTNESLIGARFRVSVGRGRGSPWRVEPSQGLVEPCSEVRLSAICRLVDRARYEDVIRVEVEHSHAQEIAVRAVGVGCAIVSEPAIGSCVDFGRSWLFFFFFFF